MLNPATVSANFYGNLQKLNEHYEMFETLQVVDTSEVAHKVLGVFKNGEPEDAVSYFELPQWFVVNLPALAQKIER